MGFWGVLCVCVWGGDVFFCFFVCLAKQISDTSKLFYLVFNQNKAIGSNMGEKVACRTHPKSGTIQTQCIKYTAKYNTN